MHIIYRVSRAIQILYLAVVWNLVDHICVQFTMGRRTDTDLGRPTHYRSGRDVLRPKGCRDVRFKLESGLDYRVRGSLSHVRPIGATRTPRTLTSRRYHTHQQFSARKKRPTDLKRLKNGLRNFVKVSPFYRISRCINCVFPVFVHYFMKTQLMHRKIRETDSPSRKIRKERVKKTRGSKRRQHVRF
jgi:hypothetical protein